MNRKSLSDGMTYVVKFIFGPVVSLVILSFYIIMILASGEFSSLVIPTIFCGAFIVVIYLLTARLYFIEYDNEFIYVKKFFNEVKYPLHKVRRVNEPNYSRDPSFELEMEPFRGSSEKFDFLVGIEESIRYSWNETIPESVESFMHLVRQVKETHRVLQEANN